MSASQAILAQVARRATRQARDGRASGAGRDGVPSTPVKYAFARPGRPTAEILPLDMALSEIVVEPGAHQLRFFLPTGQSNRFAVVPGRLWSSNGFARGTRVPTGTPTDSRFEPAVTKREKPAVL